MFSISPTCIPSPSPSPSSISFFSLCRFLSLVSFFSSICYHVVSGHFLFLCVFICTHVAHIQNTLTAYISKYMHVFTYISLIVLVADQSCLTVFHPLRHFLNVTHYPRLIRLKDVFCWPVPPLIVYRCKPYFVLFALVPNSTQ